MGLTSASSSYVEAEQVKTKHESRIGSFHKSDDSSTNHFQSMLRLDHVGSKFSHSVPLPCFPSHARIKVRSDKTQSISFKPEIIEVQDKGRKRKFF